MSGLDYFSWVVLIISLIAAVIAFIVIAQLPGKIAKARKHPQADAINVAGWLGLILTLGFFWVLAMIWANMKPLNAADDETEQLKTRLTELEKNFSQLKESIS